MDQERVKRDIAALAEQRPMTAAIEVREHPLALGLRSLDERLAMTGTNELGPQLEASG
jgi:hypothetical protein